MGQSSAEWWLLWVELASTTNPDRVKKMVLLVDEAMVSPALERLVSLELTRGVLVSIAVPEQQDSCVLATAESHRQGWTKQASNA